MALLALAVLATTLAGPWRPDFREAVPDLAPPPVSSGASATPPPPDPLLEYVQGLDIQPWDLTWVGIALIVLAVAGVGLLVVRWIRRLSLPPIEVGPPDDAGISSGLAVAVPGLLADLPTLREGVADADWELRSHRRPADAVVAAWVRLEAAAARSGVVRDRAATPTEFTVSVLDRTPADPNATQELLRLYLRARFSEDLMTADDVAAAIAALRTLAAGLGEDDPDGSGKETR